MISNIFRVLLSPLLGRIRSRPKSPALPPLVSNQIHVFAGDFASEAAATDYALGLTRPNLAQDLGDIAIGPDDVEIVHGDARLAAARPMFHFSKPVQAGAGNTYILLSDRGYETAALVQGQVVYLGLCTIS